MNSEEHRLKSLEKDRRQKKNAGLLGDAGGVTGRFFEGLAVPMGQFGTGFVGGLAKVEKRRAGRRRAAHIFIHQDEFVEL